MMKYTYVSGYFITLRLIPEKQEDMFGIQMLISEGKVRLEHFSSPWLSRWKIVMILFEDTRLMTSGVIKNETAFILKMGIDNSDKNQTIFLESIKMLLKRKWKLKVASPISFRAEILEYTRLVGKIGQSKVSQITTTSISGVFDNGPNWRVIYMPNLKEPIWANLRRFLIAITKMFFCQQIILDPLVDAYELKNNNRLLYLKLKNKYIFEANFIMNMNGQQEVRVCLDDTDFIPQVEFVSSKVSNLTIASVYTLCTTAWVSRLLQLIFS